MATRMQDLMARARSELRDEPVERRVRADGHGRPILDTIGALLVWEPRRICPSFAVPVEDVRAGYVALDFTAFDRHEEDEQILGHPRDPYHRVDTRASSRTVRIELDREVVAETTRAQRLCEANLPLRLYLPREDVRGELVPSSFRSHCPYKGDATYFSLGAAEDVVWCYERPLPELGVIAGLVAFWNERVEIFVDGERWTPPSGPIVSALADEFGL